MNFQKAFVHLGSGDVEKDGVARLNRYREQRLAAHRLNERVLALGIKTRKERKAVRADIERQIYKSV